MSDQKPHDEAGPEEGFKFKGAIPDADDTEGHGFRGNATSDGDRPEPDGGSPLPLQPDADELGPDEGVRIRI